MSSGRVATFRGPWLSTGRRPRSSVLPPRGRPRLISPVFYEQATANLVDLDDMPVQTVIGVVIPPFEQEKTKKI